MATFDDQAQLTQLFDHAYSPIVNAGQNLVAIATAKRQREQQLADEASKEAFTVSRDTARMNHEERLVGLHAKYQTQLQKDQWDLLDARKKEEKRQEAIDEAARNGIALPANTSYQDATAASVASNGRKLVGAAKTVGSALKAYSDYLGKTQGEVMKASMAQAVGAISDEDRKTARLSLEDINGLVNNPDSMNDLIIKATREHNSAASALLNQINGTALGNLEAGMKLAEANKPALAGLSNAFKAASADLETLRKKGGVNEADSMQASRELITESLTPPKGPAQAEPLPPVKAAGATGATGPQDFRGIFPAIGQAAGAVAQAVGPVVGGVAQNTSTLLRGGNWVNPFSQMGPSFYQAPMGPPVAPAPPVDPSGASSLFGPSFYRPRAPAADPTAPVAPPPATSGGAYRPSSGYVVPRLLKSIADQTALLNQVAPTAYPANNAFDGAEPGETW